MVIRFVNYGNTNPGVVDSLADDGLGLGTRRRGSEIRFAYPVAILVAERGRD